MEAVTSDSAHMCGPFHPVDMHDAARSYCERVDLSLPGHSRVPRSPSTLADLLSVHQVHAVLFRYFINREVAQSMLNLLQEPCVAVWAPRGDVACVERAIIKAENVKVMSLHRRHALVNAVFLPECLLESVLT